MVEVPALQREIRKRPDIFLTGVEEDPKYYIAIYH
jgi:hypothetical protein